jgi:hypothetical protein
MFFDDAADGLRDAIAMIAIAGGGVGMEGIFFCSDTDGQR